MDYNPFGSLLLFRPSVVSDFVTPWTATCQASPSFSISRSLFKLMSIESGMPANHLNLCCPLLLPSIFPSIRVFSSESALHIRWSEYWSFSLSISPSKEYSALISFRIDYATTWMAYTTELYFLTALKPGSMRSSFL